MGSNSTPISICNLALGWVGGNLITSFDDDSTDSRLCKANYSCSKDYCLELRDWTFALGRKILPKMLDPPEFGYKSQYLMPAGCLRVIGASGNDRFDDSLRWELEGDKILADAGDVLYVRYLLRIEDTSRFPAQFVNVIAAKLAMDIAIPLTANRAVKQEMAQIFAAELTGASRSDSQQRRSIRLSHIGYSMRRGSDIT